MTATVQHSTSSVEGMLRFADDQSHRHPDAESAQFAPLSETRKHPLVLVVDDEPIITETIADILTFEGFEVETVNDGMAAVEQSAKLKPDIVLADVAMPRLNGIEAAKRILSNNPGTRIVLFSGQAETADLLAQARKEGFEFEVLAKPVKPQVLVRTLRSK